MSYKYADQLRLKAQMRTIEVQHSEPKPTNQPTNQPTSIL
jgi:hypothetical protein